MAKTCGPDVTDQVAKMWQTIQNHWAHWPSDYKEQAADRALAPYGHRIPGSWYDNMGWDTLPLYFGDSAWLADPGVAALGCCVPNTGPEDDGGCANTVQVHGECWLAGSVNYGTFGIMARLCEDVTVVSAHLQATTMIRAWKALDPKDTPEIPLAWFNATYHDGPTGYPKISGNRKGCDCNCSLAGDIVNWDYVWEPVKPRDIHTSWALYTPANHPVLTLPGGAPPLGIPKFGGPMQYTTSRGSTLYWIAFSVYKDGNQWEKIYNANSTKVKKDKDARIPDGTVLTIPD
jgi:hypothetical protein